MRHISCSVIGVIVFLAACGGEPSGLDSAEPVLVALDSSSLAGGWQALLASAFGTPDTIRLNLSTASTAVAARTTAAGTAVRTFLKLQIPFTVDGAATGSRVTLTLTRSDDNYPPGMPPPQQRLVLDGVKRADGVDLVGSLLDGPFVIPVQFRRQVR